MQKTCALMSALTLTACLPVLQSDDEPESSRGRRQRETMGTSASEEISTASGRISAGREEASSPATPIYMKNECGSIPAEEPTPGRTQGDAFPIELGQPVGARIDPGSTTNTEHYWRIQLTRGSYHFVLDSSTPDGGSRWSGIELTRLSGVGSDAESLTGGNRFAARFRASTFIEIKADETVVLKVTPVHGEVDYVLGVFANGTAVPSPYFAECPAITPLPLQAASQFMLGGGGPSSGEHWYSMDLEIADYEFVVESSQPDHGWMKYGLTALDRFGEADREESVLSVSQVDTDVVAMGTLEVGEAQGHWLRFSHGDGKLSMSVTATEL